MDISTRHPAIEGAAGTFLASLGTAVHFANDWLTPTLSFATALVGFAFSMHAVRRWWKSSKSKDRRKEDRLP